MYRFLIRVHMNVPGTTMRTFQDLPFIAESFGKAQQQVEAMYGAGSCGGCINEERLDY